MMMLGLFLDVYSGFLILLFLALTLLAISPRKRSTYIEKKGYLPDVLVIVPCKGREIDLVENLTAVQKQRYKDYNVIAVVDSMDDPAVVAIRKSGTNLMVADLKCEGCSGKVRAISSAISKFKDYAVYVVLDSDVLVGNSWLDLLVAPLGEEGIGLSTAYPVFEPTGGFWSKIKHAWGFVGQGLMDDERTRFGWGGSLAFRKNLLAGKDFAYFSGSISDDIALTRIAKGKGLKIAYVRDAEPTVKSDDDFNKFIEWSNRQTALFIHGNSKVFYAAMAFYCASVLLMLSSIVLGVLVSPWFLVLLLPIFIGAFKLWYRSEGYIYMIPIYFIINSIYIYNLLKARQMKSIKWRGRVYEIDKIANAKNS